MGFISLTATWSQVDPTDDFSFSLQAGSGVQRFSLISEKRVCEILSDRLDLFPRSLAPRLSRHIVELGRRHRLDPAFILSLIEIESRFRIKATSPVGALGLMQVMMPTGDFVLKNVGVYFTGQENFKTDQLSGRRLTPKILMDPFVNTAIGVAYLAFLRDHYRGLTPYHVLAAYNVGPARLDELMVRKNFRPTETKRYFLAIRRKVPTFRFYQKAPVSPRL